MTRRIGRAIVFMLVVEVHQHVTVHAVGGQENQNNEIRDQQRHVKRIGVIQPLECGVEKMLPDVLANAPRGYKSGYKRR
jgi:hypothetical protein